MLRKLIAAMAVVLAVSAAAPAQTAGWRFRWEKGQVLTYRVEQTTTVAEVVGDRKNGFTSKLALTKRWRVTDVDGDGVATVELSLASMRNELTDRDGELHVFDSADPDKADKQMKEELSKYVGAVLAVLRVDGLGRVVEVKESKFGPASKFESDLPFKAVVPGADVKEGTAWERKYQITLEPPQGTGEKYDARQKYVCKSVKDGAATLALTTTLVNPPEGAGDQAPLAQSQPEGEVVFDVKAGRLQSAKLHIDKEIKNHQGDGSSYRFTSSYLEEYAGDK
jgi:hypothetical protein